MVIREKVTLEAFRQFVEQPENAERLFELINGEIAEKMPGTTRNSGIAMNVVGETGSFCKQNHIPCVITGEAGSYNILGRVFAPDFAFKQTPTSAEYPDPAAPLWVVEVISPNDKPRDIRAKRMIYLQAEILYWEVYPEDQSIDVYVAGQLLQTYRAGDRIAVGNLIPGFTLAVAELFE